ncbi:aminopeptidase N [Biomphalaria pfeifferi]|uniref:Aminopeptidase n=1 Tax=Biomphalaria pfeifferi TaxID=112525 RepID=A0AAD8AYP0_BIOPF|nr:aminopeptidase N [Biomphalaria pfeifferi]
MENRRDGCYAGISFVVLLVLFAAAVTVTIYLTRDQQPRDIRLPISAVPFHYNLEIQTCMNTPKPKDFYFKGNVTIWFNCRSVTKNITLHSVNLQILDAKLSAYGQRFKDSDPIVLSYDIDSERQFLILNLDRELKVNKTYLLHIQFKGELNTVMLGYFHGSYTINDSDHFYTVTQFEPTYARSVFPCFDEPAMKSTFNVTLVRPSHLNSLSNTQRIRTGQNFSEGNVTYVSDVYDMTPYMSTYLFSTWAPPSKVNSTRFALDIGVDLLHFFEEFYNISYNLPKLDMITFKHFAFGGMENWGLITYNDDHMLYEEGTSSLIRKMIVARTISHELSHQWFGNLVTMAWWDDLWLNEGFAKYMDSFGVDNINPDYNAVSTFVVSDVFRVMRGDSLVTSRPVYTPVTRNEFILQLVDDITYTKGAALIRMLSNFIGLDTFKQALRVYLKTKSYSNANHDELWETFTKQAAMDSKHINVKDVMDPWLHQMNYPLVTIKRDGPKLVLRQERFLEEYRSDPNKTADLLKNPTERYTWNIPLTFMTNQSRHVGHALRDIHWMWKNETTKVLNYGHGNRAGQATKWILANIDHYGFYRVNYDVDNWMALCEQLNQDHTVIPMLNRAQLINDAWTLALSGRLSTDVAMATLSYLHKENDVLVWIPPGTILHDVMRRLMNTAAYDAFKKYLRCKLSQQYQHILHKKGNTIKELQANELFSALACMYGIENCLKEAHRQFSLWMNNSSSYPIDRHILGFISCSAVAYGGWDAWNFAYEMFQWSSSYLERRHLLNALSCSQSPSILNRYLVKLLEPSDLRLADPINVINHIMANPNGRALAWNFFRANFAQLYALYGESVTKVAKLADHLNTQYELDQLKEFIKVHVKEDYADVIKTVEANIRWISSNGDGILKFLQKVHSELC